MVALSAFGQKQLVSGYMGHRNYVSFNATASPSTDPQSAVSYKDAAASGESMNTVNKEFGFNLGRVLSKSVELEANFSWFKTSVNLKDGFSNSNFGDNILFDNMNFSLIDIEGFPDIRGRKMGIGCKILSPKFGSRAPLGVYFGVNLSHLRIKTDYHDIHFKSPSSTGGESHFFDTTAAYGYLQVGLEIGKTMAIGSRLLFNYGANIAYNLPTKYVDDRDVLANALLIRMNSFSVLNIHAGLAFAF